MVKIYGITILYSEFIPRLSSAGCLQIVQVIVSGVLCPRWGQKLKNKWGNLDGEPALYVRES